MRTKPINLANYNGSDTVLTSETSIIRGDKILYVIGIMDEDSARSIYEHINITLQDLILLAMKKAGYEYTDRFKDFDWSDIDYNKGQVAEWGKEQNIGVKVLFEIDAHRHFKRITIEEIFK